MEPGWSALALLCLAGAAAWFWQDSLGARENANAAAIEACRRLGLQFLDGTVAFARLSLTREAGWLRLHRTYVFDYTANSIERRQGFVVLTGHRVESVGYAREDYTGGEERRAPPLPPAPEPPQYSPPPDDSKVLSLEDWRARSRKPADPAPQRQDGSAGNH